MSWPTVTLGEVAEWGSGGTPSRGNRDFYGGEIPWATIGDLTDGEVTYTAESITEAGLSQSSAKLVQPGAVLIAMYGSIGKLGILTIPLATNQAIAFAYPGEHLDLRFLFHYLRGQREQLLAAGNGGTQSNISQTKLKAWTIPLPPLPEQRRIAAILDHADTLRAKRKQSLGLLDTLSRAVFVQMFGDPRKSESNTLLGDVAEFYAGGTLPDGETFAGQSGGYQLLKVSDLNLSGNETFLKSSVLWSAKGGARAATCPTGSVVIPKRGGAIGTNKKRLTVRSAVLDPNLMGIAPIDEFLISDFLFGWFQFLDLASIQSGSSVPQLNKRDLAPLAIGIPDLAEQREFGRRVGRIRSLATNGASLLDTCEALFRSVQSRAFRGEL